MRRWRPIIASSFLALSGCASFYTGGPIREAAARIAVPERHRINVTGFSPSAAAELAVENSVELRAERKALDAREDAWRIGVRAYLPQMEISYGSDERVAMHSSDSFSKKLSANLSQPLWDGGRLSASRALEAADIAIVRGELERKARDVREGAISAYRSVSAARARLAVKRESLARADADRDVLVAEVKVGAAIASDLLEADLYLTGLEIELAQAELELAMAESELTEVLGVERLPASMIPLDTNARVVSVDGDAAASMAVERSPELALARHDIIRKRAEAKASAYAWLPTIGLKVDAMASGSSFPLREFSWSVGLSAEFSGPFLSGRAGATLGGDLPHDRSAGTSGSFSPIPDPAGALSARQAAIACELEQERFAGKVAEIEREARGAAAVYLNAARRRDLCLRSLELSEQACRLVELRRDLGQATGSEALKAELERAKRAVELVDAAEGLCAAERDIERLVDSLPGALEDLFGASARGEP